MYPQSQHVLIALLNRQIVAAKGATKLNQMKSRQVPPGATVAHDSIITRSRTAIDADRLRTTSL